MIFHDISSLKEREIALHRSEQQYRRLKDLYKQLSDASFEAIFLSKDGICIGQNMMAEKMFGYSLEEALGRAGVDWIASESRELVAEQIAAGFEGQYEASALRKDGTVFPCEIQARISVASKTGIRITALRDIAYRKRAEKDKLDAIAFAATQSKYALVGQVAVKMAHDFNNILGVIMGNTELALAGCSDRELTNTLELILGQTLRGKNLTRNLVAFAQDQEPKQARFIIELPVVERELSLEEKQEVSSQGILPGRNILLVEDEIAISDIQYNVLTQAPCHHRVDVADNGSRALALFSSNPYDLVSLDYVLPGALNGIDVYQEIREADSEIPILFVSGNIEFLESIKALKAEDPFIDHLSKPCLNKEYVRAVHGLLKQIPTDRKQD